MGRDKSQTEERLVLVGVLWFRGAMITEVTFKNYRAIEDASLELGPLTLLVGPNGSGKTSVLNAFRYFKGILPDISELQSVGGVEKPVEFGFKFTRSDAFAQRLLVAAPNQPNRQELRIDGQPNNNDSLSLTEAARIANGLRYYAFDASKMREPVTVTPYRTLKEDGSNLAGFLDYIRDNGSDSFEELKKALNRSAPEYDDIGFDGFGSGQKTFKLRRTGSRSFVAARHLSEGTLYIVALLAMLYQPDLPALLCIEEPDRGLHPRLYREIRDTLYRLAYPQDFGETRTPVQIVATTHSPYFLNEFTDRPEQVVICEKGADHRVAFRNLGKDPEARRILDDAMIGDAWATGALGGVPAHA
jgi:predicted ATPase